MSETTTNATAGSNPFNARTVGILIAVALFAFGAIMTLSAFSQDLRPKNGAASNPYSSAATGYAGFVDILKRTGKTVRLSRIERTIEDRDQGLLIITTEPYGMSDLESRSIQGPALIVLPKWYGYKDPAKPTWQVEMDLIATETARLPLQIFDEDGDLWRIRTPASLKTPFGKHDIEVEEDLQVIRSDLLEPIVSTAAGDLVAKMPYDDIYFLSDPDLVNTFGLADVGNARFATGLVDWLQYYDENAVIFDVTLHGFVRSENLLQMALSIPFLGATLTALAAAGLLGWAASLRFGAPEREGRVIALGKQALTDNTAGLVSMARRETRLAPGYLALTRRAAAKDVGAPKSLSEAELAALFDRMSPDDDQASRWSRLADALRTTATSPGDLVTKARAIYRWRKETTHGRN